MYVIWRKRKRERYAGWDKIGDVRLTPIIVQSRRVNGLPKQEHIACLPSIIESHIDEKNAVWFWRNVEKRLARLTNRIPPAEMKKIRDVLAKKVPQPSPEYVKELTAGAQAHLESMVSVLGPRSEHERKINKRMQAFSNSLKTARVCADCGEGLETVYRERRTFGRGIMGGTRWTTGVLCKQCAHPPRARYDFRPHRFRHYGPCETCGREVFISRSIPALCSFCSTHCGQVHYRKVRRLRLANSP